MGGAQAVPGAAAAGAPGPCSDVQEFPVSPQGTASACAEEACKAALESLRRQGAAGVGAVEELLETCGFQVARRRKRASVDQEIEELIQQLFRLQDLNENGFLEESELIQLNKKVAMLHYGKDINKEEVTAKYQELFRSNLDASGQPIPVETFRTYILDVLRAVDPDKQAQQMILEQWIAEAALGRNSFADPRLHSFSDLPFLLLKSFDVDPLAAAVLYDQYDKSRIVQTPPVASASDGSTASPSAASSDEDDTPYAEVHCASALPQKCAAAIERLPSLPRAPAPSEATSSGMSTWPTDGTLSGPAVQVVLRGAEVQVALSENGHGPPLSPSTR